MRWGRDNGDAWNASEVIAKQLAMNQQTWVTLRAHGLTEESEVRLDFFYEAPSRNAAEELTSFLREETDYDVNAADDSVTGRTQPTTVDPETLDQWVEWMVAAGAEKGRCKFDGWGTQVRSSPAG